MERIKAINHTDTQTEIVTPTTEKIVEELNDLYSQALRTKQSGHHERAIELFHKILDYDEIKEANDAIKHRTEFALKYCCYKNLAELHELTASYRYALEYFLLASDMDDSDVYFLNKFGHIALLQQQFDLANAIFQRCLELNSNHMPSFDGILKILCLNEDYLEAYGYSIYCHSKFPKWQRPIDVIHDAGDVLKQSPLLQCAFTPSNDAVGKRSTKPSCFPPASYIDNVDQSTDGPSDFRQFKLTTVSFLAFGRTIKSIYNESSRVTSYLTAKIQLDDICDINDISAEHDTIEMNMTKPMVGLQAISMESRSCIIPITPIQQIFREIIPQYFSTESVDDELIHVPSMVRTISQPGYLDLMKDVAGDDLSFHDASMSHLQKFIKILKSKPFDLMTLVFEWLKSMSECSHIQLPVAVQPLYIEIYEQLANYMDWAGVTSDLVVDLFRMALFYIELRVVASVRDKSFDSEKMPRLFDDQTMRQFYYIVFQKSLFRIDCDVMLELRLNVLHLQLAIELHEYDLAGDLLDRIQEVFVNVSTNIEILHLPNQFYCPFVDSWIVANEKSLLECLQQEKRIVTGRKMHNTIEQFNDVLTILLKYQQRHFASVKLPAYLQLEMIVESMWMMDRLEECLSWCEKGFHDAMSAWWMCTVKNQRHPNHLPQHTRFLTVYLRHLLRDNSLLINSLNGRKERLVRSMTYLFDAQYYQPQEQQQQQQQQPDEQHQQPPPSLNECLFDSSVFIETLDLILKNDQQFYDAAEQQTAVLNIIGLVAEWLIRNNIPNDGTFLMNVWNTALNFNGYDMTVLKFSSVELIRLLSHSIFGFPNAIDEHQIGCTCKRRPIDWNGVSLLFTSFDSITHGMPEPELKSLINDLLNTIPADVQMNLCDGISQLNDFLNDIVDFPYKSNCKLLKTFPPAIVDIFHRIAAIGHNAGDYYGGYSHEQLITIDLLINPQRFSSWLTLMHIKIGQLDALFTDTHDLTKIDVAVIRKLKNAIDACFDKCEMLNQAENTITNVDYLWSYSLHLYKFSKHTEMMAAATTSSQPVQVFGQSWNRAKRILDTYLMATKAMYSPAPPIQSHQISLCYFLLGKITEKKKLTKQSLTFYQLAERQLFDHQNNETFLMIKLEINFRITASIYKYVTQRTNDGHVIDKNGLLYLLHVLKRDRQRVFNDTELVKRGTGNQTAAASIADSTTAIQGPTTDTVTIANDIDENANQINGSNQKHLITELHQLCAVDFEWYLELYPNYYKAAYYLIKMNLNKDDSKCRALLLQMSRKNTEQIQGKKLSLFEIHRSRHLMKVKEPLHLSPIHDTISFAKYMEKCVHILVEYLSQKPNWYLQFVLAMQWSKLLRMDSSTTQLKLHQKQQLFTKILDSFIRSAENHVKQFNRITAKAKTFLDFYMNIYELYKNCEPVIKSQYNANYSKLMIECYHLCGGEPNDRNMDVNADLMDEFQQAMKFCATETSNRAKAKKASTTKANKPDNNLPTSSTNNNSKKRRASEAK